mmetsp:Transcript_64946/g.186880  ORF Transcript_64946/g.186880 Transcript_64946/m.186880 type:complete len:267 (-) Transcript_64946:130-930(-)
MGRGLPAMPDTRHDHGAGCDAGAARVPIRRAPPRGLPIHDGQLARVQVRQRQRFLLLVSRAGLMQHERLQDSSIGRQRLRGRGRVPGHQGVEGVRAARGGAALGCRGGPGGPRGARGLRGCGRGAAGWPHHLRPRGRHVPLCGSGAVDRAAEDGGGGLRSPGGSRRPPRGHRRRGGALRPEIRTTGVRPAAPLGVAAASRGSSFSCRPRWGGGALSHGTSLTWSALSVARPRQLWPRPLLCFGGARCACCSDFEAHRVAVPGGSTT